MRLIDADAILKADENSDKALVLGSGKSLEIAYALLKKKVADVRQEHMDRVLAEIIRDKAKLIPFPDRYKDLKKIRYGR